MFPALAIHNPLDSRFCYAIVGGNAAYCLSGGTRGTDGVYVIIGQLSAMMAFALWAALWVRIVAVADAMRSATGIALEYLTTLCCHITAIIGCRAEPQMRGVDTRRIVAGMTHEQATGDRAVMQLPRNPMGCGIC